MLFIRGTQLLHTEMFDMTYYLSLFIFHLYLFSWGQEILRAAAKTQCWFWSLPFTQADTHIHTLLQRVPWPSRVDWGPAAGWGKLPQIIIHPYECTYYRIQLTTNLHHNKDHLISKRHSSNNENKRTWFCKTTSNFLNFIVVTETRSA